MADHMEEAVNELMRSMWKIRRQIVKGKKADINEIAGIAQAAQRKADELIYLSRAAKADINKPITKELTLEEERLMNGY